MLVIFWFCFVCLFVLLVSHLNRCELVSQCDFDLHFSNNQWCWASFHVLISDFWVFLISVILSLNDISLILFIPSFPCLFQSADFFFQVHPSLGAQPLGMVGPNISPNSDPKPCLLSPCEHHLLSPLSLATCCDSSCAYLSGFQFPLYFLLLEKSSMFL